MFGHSIQTRARTWWAGAALKLCQCLVHLSCFFVEYHAADQVVTAPCSDVKRCRAPLAAAPQKLQQGLNILGWLCENPEHITPKALANWSPGLLPPWTPILNKQLNSERVRQLVHETFANTFGVTSLDFIRPHGLSNPGLQLANAFGVKQRFPHWHGWR